MYPIEFYERNGISPLWNELEELRIQTSRNKDARIQFNQMSLYIELLQNHGTMLPSTIVKHVEDGIWELRPGNNRILFFFFLPSGSFVLLHSFRKKTQKTPRREIDKAIRERNDYIQRKEAAANENLE